MGSTVCIAETVNAVMEGGNDSSRYSLDLDSGGVRDVFWMPYMRSNPKGIRRNVCPSFRVHWIPNFNDRDIGIASFARHFCLVADYAES